MCYTCLTFIGLLDSSMGHSSDVVKKIMAAKMPPTWLSLGMLMQQHCPGALSAALSCSLSCISVAADARVCMLVLPWCTVCCTVLQPGLHQYGSKCISCRTAAAWAAPVWQQVHQLQNCSIDPVWEWDTLSYAVMILIDRDEYESATCGVPYWLTYDFPPEVSEKLKHQWGSDWKGQAQKCVKVYKRMDLLNNSSDSQHQDADFDLSDDLLLAAYLGGLTLGVGERDVESSFWELETFLNSETYEPLILGAASCFRRELGTRKLGLRIEDEHGHGDPMVSPSLQNTQSPPKFFSPNPTIQSFHSNMALLLL
nr:nudix hydrolase 26, chloroplastic [Quercus suber]